MPQASLPSAPSGGVCATQGPVRPENGVALESVEQPDAPNRGTALLLLTSVFVIATCGLIYELLAGTLSSYLLGNSITQFSLVIGIFLTAMGIGSYVSRFVVRHLVEKFLAIEIAVGVIGGSSPLVLFFCFAILDNYTPVLIGISTLTGALVGLEIPLLIRILRSRYSLKSAIGNVLSADYLGALAASLLFPLVLVPRLGLVRTGCVFGMLNILVAAIGLKALRDRVRSRRRRQLAVCSIIAGTLLFAGLVTAGSTTRGLEDTLYDDAIVFSKSTPYQRIVVTRWHDDIRLFVDGNIQFSSSDEFRYHETLVHPAMGLARHPKRVLILGGGDGLAAREVLKHSSVNHIDLVDLDHEITRLFKMNTLLSNLNNHAFDDVRVHVHNEDAQKFLEQRVDRYEVIIIDLPDPNNESVGKLYTRSFYRLVAKHLSRGGILATQATSPYYSNSAFWCIVNTIAATNTRSGRQTLEVRPYHAYVPSFGDWGFVLASESPLPTPQSIDVDTRFLTKDMLPRLFVFPKDIGPRETPINRLDEQILVQLYESEFRRYNN